MFRWFFRRPRWWSRCLAALHLGGDIASSACGSAALCEDGGLREGRRQLGAPKWAQVRIQRRARHDPGGRDERQAADLGRRGRPTRPKGPKGATGLTGYQIVTNVASNASAIFSVGGRSATCPSGESVLGGGGNVTRTDGSTGGSERSIIDSSPTSNHDGWVIDWSVTSGASDPGYTATVYAVCATVASS